MHLCLQVKLEAGFFELSLLSINFFQDKSSESSAKPLSITIVWSCDPLPKVANRGEKGYNEGG